MAPFPTAWETRPLLPPGGKDFPFLSGLCKQPLLRNVFLAALFFHTENSPMNFIISAEEGQDIDVPLSSMNSAPWKTRVRATVQWEISSNKPQPQQGFIPNLRERPELPPEL